MLISAGTTRGLVFIFHYLTQQFRLSPSFRLPLTVELFRKLAFFILSCKPISYCRFKRIDVYIL